MNRKFKERFEEELQKAKDSLSKKNGTKNYEKVIERVGRARQKYPSVSKYYVIDYIADDPKNPKNMADILWRIAVPRTWTSRAASISSGRMSPHLTRRPHGTITILHVR